MRRGVLRHRDERDLHARHLLHHHPAKAFDGRAIGVRDVDRGPRIFRGFQFLVEILHPEIIFMVAGYREVEGHHIGELDHVHPAVEAREQRGREQVAVKQVKEIRVGGALGPRHRIEPRHAAPRLAALELVNIAHAKQRDLHHLRLCRSEGHRAQKSGHEKSGNKCHAALPHCVGRKLWRECREIVT